MFKFLLLIFGLIFGRFALLAQDPFFTHFNGAESYYNPAMTGIKGSRSYGLKYKSQWGTATIAPFQTGLINFEESLPCLPFDLGATFGFDQEGAGRLQTYDLGVKLSGGPNFPLGDGLLNIRFGLNAQVSQKSVNFSKFTFSDQLDPKYGTVDANGNLNPTSFIPPTDGRTRAFFTPALGVVFHMLSSTRESRPTSLLFGAAMHNAYSVGRPKNGHIESLLGLDVDIPERYNAFCRLDLIPIKDKSGLFISLTPSAFYQRQGKLSYWEAGLRLGFSRFAGLGLLYHHNHLSGLGTNTKWMSFNVDIGQMIGNYTSRVDYGFSYSWNQSGLKNIADPIFEFTLTYHCGRGLICRNNGKGADYSGKKSVNCYNFDNKRGRIYENIWYKTLNFNQK